jgi:hypothetical protein
MGCKRVFGSAFLTAALAATPLATAKADPAYIAFPPLWPLITLGAIVDAATAPLRPYYYLPPPCYCVAPGPAYPPPAYSAPAPYQPGYYPAR